MGLYRCTLVKSRSKNNVGNGGFSIRTTKLMDAVKNIPIHTSLYLSDGHAEDALISRHYGTKLEEYGIRFAPAEIAINFSSENPSVIGKSFGFHGAYNFPFYLPENILIEHHDELLERINKPPSIGLLLFNATKANYHDLIKTCQQHLHNKNPEKLNEIANLFKNNNLNK